MRRAYSARTNSQVEVFTAWVNAVLSKTGSDPLPGDVALENCFQTGQILQQLLLGLTGQRVSLNKRVSLITFRRANVKKMVDAFKAAHPELDLRQLSAEDFISGNQMMVRSSPAHTADAASRCSRSCGSSCGRLTDRPHTSR